MSPADALRRATGAIAPVVRAAGAGLLVFAMAACAPTGGPADGAAPRIALASTPDRPGYAALLQGATLALEAVNAERRAGGRPPITLAQPDRSATSAVEVATKWRDDESIVGAIGHTESGATLDALPVVSDEERQGARALAVVSPTATSPALRGRSRWLFRLVPDDAAVSHAVAAQLRDSLRAERAAVIYRNDSYGRDWLQVFRAAFEARGGTLVLREPYLTGVTEWDAYAALVARRQPDVVLFPGDADAAVALLRALRRAGVTAPFIGGDGTVSLLATDEFPDARVLAFFGVDSLRAPSARAFLVRYRELHGRYPDIFAAAGYDAALTLARAIAATETAGRGQARRVAVRDWIAALGQTRAPLDGVTGPIGFDSAQAIVSRPVRLVRHADAPLLAGVR